MANRKVTSKGVATKASKTLRSKSTGVVMKSEIICIIDRSGSIVDDAIGGFNTFLEQQKKVFEMRM